MTRHVMAASIVLTVRPRPVLAVLLSVVCAMAPACRQARAPAGGAGNEPEVQAERSPAPDRLPADDPASLVAVAAHGGLFDRSMKEVPFDLALVERVQNGIIARIPGAVQTTAGRTPAVKEALESAKDGGLAAMEAALLKSGAIKVMLTLGSAEVSKRYAATNEALLRSLLDRFDPKQATPPSRDLFDRLGVIVDSRVQGPVGPTGPTAYQQLCRLLGVPQPPDWDDGDFSTQPWVLQGALTTKMIMPSEEALVYTYSDPTVRGACIALARSGSSPMLGIICQGAYSGAACFWDNIDVRSRRRLPYRGERIAINQLQDATNLSDLGACPQCHRGNNVFLIAPDDPTWAKVLRGPLDGPHRGTFTTVVEPLLPSDPDRPYTPVTGDIRSGLRDRPGWTPERLDNGCIMACHLDPGAQSWRSVPMMSPNGPACAQVPGGGPDVRRCYGPPQ